MAWFAQVVRERKLAKEFTALFGSPGLCTGLLFEAARGGELAWNPGAQPSRCKPLLTHILVVVSVRVYAWGWVSVCAWRCAHVWGAYTYMGMCVCGGCMGVGVYACGGCTCGVYVRGGGVEVWGGYMCVCGERHRGRKPRLSCPGGASLPHRLLCSDPTWQNLSGPGSASALEHHFEANAARWTLQTAGTELCTLTWLLAPLGPRQGRVLW